MSKSAFKKKFYHGAVVAILTAFIVLVSVGNGLAYTTENYQVDVTVNENNSYRFTESITVNFDGLQHGIFRYIPMEGSSGLTALKIDRIDVDGWNYDKYIKGNNQVIEIGDPEHYLTGKQIFTFGYRLRVYDDKNLQGDMLYIDLLPTNWETPLERVEIHLRMPKAIEEKYIEIYTPGYGSDGALDYFSWDYDAEKQEISIDGHDVPQGVGVTLYCPLPEGYWVNPLSSDWAGYAAVVLVFLVPLLVCLLWFFFGRNRKIGKTIEFYPPKGLTPAETGCVLHGIAGRKDLLSLVGYLADRGYLKIHQSAEDTFLLEKLRDVAEEEKSFVHTFFDGLFRQERRVNPDTLGEEFEKSYSRAQDELEELYKRKKKRSERISQMCRFLGVVLLCGAVTGAFYLTALYSHDGELVYNAFLVLLLLFFAQFILIMREDKRRGMKKSNALITLLLGLIFSISGCLTGGVLLMTVSGNLWLGLGFMCMVFLALLANAHMIRQTATLGPAKKLSGLRRFLQIAEPDQLHVLLNENPHYFYDILPYACGMGLGEQWAERFQSMELSKPEWYDGDGDRDGVFDIGILVGAVCCCEEKIGRHIPEF